jgi:glucokinase
VILAGDVGGTKTHLALYEPGGTPRAPACGRKLASREYSSLESLVQAFLANAGQRAERAVIGVAGPIVGDRVEATNLPWQVEAPRLSTLLGGAQVRLMNDLETTAWGLAELSDGEFETLHAGTALPGNRVLLAAGTGLGEALAIWDGRTWRPSASEGGHADFAPRDEVEDELLRWLRARHGRVSYERVLSGRGLADLYRFLSETGRGAASEAVARRFATAEDPAAVVTDAALDGSCERARLALERFASAYGAEAGNLALKALAVNGVYLGGGIAPRILPFLHSGSFQRAFAAKGRLSPMLERIPVRLILDDRAALWGAAAVALRDE